MESNNTLVWYPEVIHELPPYKFEMVDSEWWYAMFNKHYRWSVWVTLGYLLVICGLKMFMENRQPLKLEKVHFIWNLGMVLLSLVSLTRIVPDLIFVTKENHGFISGLCTRGRLNIVSAFWALVLILSKFVQLGDTFFIVLLKKRLHPFHLIHHAIVCLSGVYIVLYPEPFIRLFGLLNCSMHVVLYSAIAVKSLGYKLSPQINLAILTIEVGHIVVTFICNWYTALLIVAGYPCYRHKQLIAMYGIASSILIYSSIKLLHGYLKQSKTKVH